MRTMRAMRRSITVVDMAVDDSPRVRSEALPLAIILDRELILSVQSAVVCSTGRVRKCSQLVDHRRVIGGKDSIGPGRVSGARKTEWQRQRAATASARESGEISERMDGIGLEGVKPIPGMSVGPEGRKEGRKEKE